MRVILGQREGGMTGHGARCGRVKAMAGNKDAIRIEHEEAMNKKEGMERNGVNDQHGLIWRRDNIACVRRSMYVTDTMCTTSR